MNKSKMFLGLLAIAMVSFTVTASADVVVYVGYADGVRGPATFPSPWEGDPNVQFQGADTSTFSPDAGRCAL